MELLVSSTESSSSKVKTANHITQRGLCVLRDGKFEILDGYDSFFTVTHHEEQCRINFCRNVVFGYDLLSGNIHNQ